ncbi:MAG: hypothetical protein ACFCVD_09980 [Nodosilinea sp.]
MLAQPSLTHRIDTLEAIIRQALLFAELSSQAEATVRAILQQPDLTPDELRMLTILQDALDHGYVHCQG